MAVAWVDTAKFAAPTGEDLELKEFHAGRLDPADGLIKLATTPAQVDGVLIGSPQYIGDTGTIRHSDGTQVCIGAAVNPATQRWLVPDAQGRFVPGTSGQRSMVKALSRNDAVNGLVTALVINGGVTIP